MLITVLLSSLHLLIGMTNPAPDQYYEAEAKSGDGVIKLMSRYHLDRQACNLDEFYRLNEMSSGDYLLAGRNYKLPILIYSYNGKSIRSTLNIKDYDHAVRIQKYNELLHRSGIRDHDYRSDNILWVPYHELHCLGSTVPKASSRSSYHLPILGQKYADIEIKSKKLDGQVYYIIAGHGGPDPGAVGKRNAAMLCEDEYAYDVSLRLYRSLLEQGAKAYLIIEDQNDGIRDNQILPCDQDERCRGAEIPLNQLKRLKQRVLEVNKLYVSNQKKGFKKQTCLSIHVDSRATNHRQDVFFCHYPSSSSSKKLAETLKKTFAAKYKKHRKGGHYAGMVDARDNLYVLRKTAPRCVLVELANIQNKSDHRRIIQSSNRQALANWMVEALIADAQ